MDERVTDMGIQMMRGALVSLCLAEGEIHIPVGLCMEVGKYELHMDYCGGMLTLWASNRTEREH